MSHGYDVERDLRTLMVDDIDANQVTEDILYELFSQFGVVTDIRWKTVDRDRMRGQEKDEGAALLRDRVRTNTAFVEYRTSSDAEYAFQVLSDCRIKLFGKDMRVVYRSMETLRKLKMTGGVIDTSSVAKRGSASLFGIGAKLHVSNLKKTTTLADLRELFSRFGNFAEDIRLLTDRDGHSKGECIVSYDSFAASDAALDAMQGKVWKDTHVKIEYANLEDRSGAKHGSVEERKRALLFAEKERSHAAAVAASSEGLQRKREAAQGGELAWAQGVPTTAETPQTSVYGRI